MLEQLGTATVLARANVGRPPPPPRRLRRAPPLIDALERGLDEAIAANVLVLPNLEYCPALAVLSDYAGEVDHHRHYTYSFLVGAFAPSPFVAAMEELRPQLATPKQRTPCEIGFKNLGFGPLQRALPAYLRALDDHIHGLLCTVAVPKNAVGLLVEGAPSALAERNQLSDVAQRLGIVGWKPKPLERMARIVQIQAYLVARLSVSGQRLFWMTDADAIAATPAKFRQTTNNLYSVLVDLYGVDHFRRFGVATPFGHDKLALLDALSAADLAAGVWAQALADLALTEQHQQLLKWHSTPGAALNKIMILVEPTKDATGATLNVKVKVYRDPPLPAVQEARAPRQTDNPAIMRSTPPR